MIQDLAQYGAVMLAAVSAVWFGGRTRNNEALSTSNTRIASLENTVRNLESDKTGLEKEIQMHRRRELWRERREGILSDRLVDEGLDLPPLPEAPESWSV